MSGWELFAFGALGVLAVDVTQWIGFLRWARLSRLELDISPSGVLLFLVFVGGVMSLGGLFAFFLLSAAPEVPAFVPVVCGGFIAAMLPQLAALLQEAPRLEEEMDAKADTDQGSRETAEVTKWIARFGPGEVIAFASLVISYLTYRRG